MAEEQVDNDKIDADVRQAFGDAMRALCATAYGIAKDKGWHEQDRQLPELIALMHSELSEVLEEHRNGHAPTEVYFGENGKPEGIPIELADTCIRIFDACGKFGINLGEAILAKLEYNVTRPYRHGGKVA